MSEAVCPCCNGNGRVPEHDPIADLVAELLARCEARGYWLSPELEVRTAAAAKLLGLSEQWLRTQACYYGLIPSRRLGKHRLWKLADLAAYLIARPDV